MSQLKEISRVNNQAKQDLTIDESKDEQIVGVDLVHPKSLPEVKRSSEATPQGSPELVSKKMPNVWVYDGEAYDLSDFIKRHPGGEFFIGRTKNRDITTLVNIFHRNPELDFIHQAA